MPELPDVEVFKQYIDATVLHQNITCGFTCWPNLLGCHLRGLFSLYLRISFGSFSPASSTGSPTLCLAVGITMERF
jgi:hypothetical protein